MKFKTSGMQRSSGMRLLHEESWLLQTLARGLSTFIRIETCYCSEQNIISTRQCTKQAMTVRIWFPSPSRPTASNRKVLGCCSCRVVEIRLSMEVQSHETILVVSKAFTLRLSMVLRIDSFTLGRTTMPRNFSPMFDPQFRKNVLKPATPQQPAVSKP